MEYNNDDNNNNNNNNSNNNNNNKNKSLVVSSNLHFDKHAVSQACKLNMLSGKLTCHLKKLWLRHVFPFEMAPFLGDINSFSGGV